MNLPREPTSIFYSIISMIWEIESKPFTAFMPDSLRRDRITLRKHSMHKPTYIIDKIL